MPFTVGELAEMLGGAIEGDASRQIRGANSLENAGEGELAFAANPKALAAVRISGAGCLLVPIVFNERLTPATIRVADPRAAFAKALERLYPRKRLAAGIHPSAVIAESARIGAGCHIGPHVSIGADTRIGDGCEIGAGCVVGEQVTIGGESILRARVTIYDRVSIGARTLVHAGSVIGADGFGFSLVADHYEKFPQVGTVDIGDDVEIGANCCIDRAALGVTRIGKGTKLDNLVHIAHNCLLGEHVVVAAQAGFSGSVTVGDYAMIGGQAGIGEKAKIAAKAVVGGKAGVLTGQTVRAGEPVWGIPARPLRGHLKGLAYVQKLPDLNELVREIQQRVDNLEKSLGTGSGEAE